MIAGILLLGLALRLVSLNQSFWLDETAQAVLSRAPIFSVHYAADFQPPLYYVLGHFWMLLGNSIGIGHAEWFLRLPSVCFGVATIFFLYKLGEKLFSKNTGLLAAFFLAIAPFHIYYSQEFRMYSLLTLLCLLCWNALYDKKWISFSVFVTLSLFTHYFAFVNLFAMGIYFLSTRNKRGLGYLVAGFVPFTLWIPTFLTQLETAHQLVSLWPKWSTVSNAGFFKFLPLLAAKWTVGMISPSNKFLYAISVVIFVLIGCISTFYFFRSMTLGGVTKRGRYHVLVQYGITPILIAWFAGLWIPAATPTRIQFVLPAIYLIVAQGCIHALVYGKYKKITYIGITIFCAIQLFFSAQYLLDQKNHREDWRSAITYSDTYISDHTLDDTIILTAFNDKWAPMDWYSKYPEKYVGGKNYQPTTPEPQNIVLYTYLFEIFDSNKSVEASLTKNYTVTEEIDFRGVGIVKTHMKNL